MVCLIFLLQTPVEVELHISRRHKQLLKWRGVEKSVS